MLIIEVKVGKMTGRQVFRTDAGTGSSSHDFDDVLVANFSTWSKVTC